MRILQILPYFAWSYGGPVRVVYELSENLSKAGHDVTIYTTNVNRERRLGEFDKPKFKYDVEIRYFECLNNWMANRMKLHISRSMHQAIKTDMKKFDIVHLHEYRSIPHVYVWYYAKKYGVPYIVQAHGASPRTLVGQGAGLVLSKTLYDTIFGKKIVKGASKVIALTRTEADQYKKMGVEEGKIEIIPNGIDLSACASLPKRGGFRRKYSISDDEKIILYLGRIHKTKGLDLPVNALPDLVKELNNVRLVVVGPDDGFLPNLKKQIKDLKIDDRILFTGPLYERDRLGAYTDADVYVLPSVYETFPITVLEACACGVPVIVTKQCGIANLVERYELGCVIEHNEKDLQIAILKFFSDNEFRKKAGENGKKLIKERFGWPVILKRVEKVYDEVGGLGKSNPEALRGLRI